jgi:hypothetical protein
MLRNEKLKTKLQTNKQQKRQTSDEANGSRQGS